MEYDQLFGLFYTNPGIYSTYFSRDLLSSWKAWMERETTETSVENNRNIRRKQ
jgi:hypothetical protein